MNILWLLSVVFIGVVSGFPSRNGYHLVPQRAVMFGGYYSNPIFGRSHEFVPQGAMSGFVTKDAVATNSFSGNAHDNIPTVELPLDLNASVEGYGERNDAQEAPVYGEEGAVPQRIPVNVPQSAVEEEVSVVADVSTEAAVVTNAPSRVSRKKKGRKPVVVVEDDDEDEEETPHKRVGGIPSNNVYFPITISGGGASRTRSGAGAAGAEDEFYYPSSATAIANSYSTGKGGIATSHATSFGDPYMAAMLFRNGYFNFRSKKGQDEA